VETKTDNITLITCHYKFTTHFTWKTLHTIID